tara:strand:- start:58027 stop:59262 length:1236 start_codon:yes stop_codon:yes gene_type:complete
MEIITESIFHQLLVLMIFVWSIAVLLSKIGLPTIMGELVVGIVLGPALLGWVEPNEVIDTLAQMGIFFLMLHTGIDTRPRDFFPALKRSWGVALLGAIVPFTVSTSCALYFGLPWQTAIFIGLVLTATAVVVTIKTLRELKLQNTTMAQVIVASSMIDSFVSLFLLSFVSATISGENLQLLDLGFMFGKVILFFAISFAIGYYLYPKFTYPFRNRNGKGFTFILAISLGAGLFAEFLGLHIILGAYIAGLFFEEQVADPILFKRVKDRIFAFSYSFLGPIFFISLGFHLNTNVFEGANLSLIFALTSLCFFGQIISAGGMAKLIGLSWIEALTVGVGMCGRAEMAFILASLGLSTGVYSDEIFSVLLITAFLLNILAILGLKCCSILLKRSGISCQTTQSAVPEDEVEVDY